jgi:biotin transporter BioY
MLAGLFTLFAGGVLWLAFFSRGPAGPVGIEAALATGLYPFILPDLAKVACASLVMPGVWKLIADKDQ